MHTNEEPQKPKAGSTDHKTARLAFTANVAFRVTAAIVRKYINVSEERGQTKAVNTLRIAREEAIDAAREVLTNIGIAPGDQSSHAEISANLSMGFLALQELLLAFGTDEESNLIAQAKLHQRPQPVVDQIGLDRKAKDELSPGKVLIDCIRDLIAAGVGHIANVDNRFAPPLNGEDLTTTNMLMGWRRSADGKMRPRGATIGYLARISGEESTAEPEVVIFILQDLAFSLAHQKYPKRIPDGMSAPTSWKNVWDLGLTHPRYPDGKGRPTTRQFRIPRTTTRMRGVPLSMQTVFPTEREEEQA